MEPDPEDWDPGSVGPMSVLYFDSAYHMWYDGYGEENEVPHASGYATSLDGITWVKDTANPVIVRGDPGEWDEWWMSDPVVYRTDTLFHMWYVGDDSLNNKYGGTNPKIGHATSKDGINWTKDPDNPVPDLAESIDSSNFMIHSIVVHDGSLFHMYFASGRRPHGIIDIYHAESENLNNWTVSPDTPVISKPKNVVSIFPMSVIHDGSQFLMWYSTYSTGSSINWRSHMAYSQDGIQWESYPHPVLIPGPYGSWDSRSIGRTIVLYDSVIHQFKMWYSGSSRNDNLEEAIGYAVSDTCSDFTIPVLSAEEFHYTLDPIEVSSSENGMIYLVPYANYYTLEAIRAASIDSVVAIANKAVLIPTVDLEILNYRIYARDNRNNISNPHKITIAVGTLEDRDKSSVSIYPNPAASMVNIQTNSSGEFSIVVETLNGKEIRSDRFNGTSHQIDLSSYQKGVYFITIRSKEFITTRKIIKL